MRAGKWWLPMSKCDIAAATAAATSALRWPEVVGAAVEVDVEQPLARHVVDEVLLAPVDDQRDAGLDPEVGLAGVPELPGLRRAPPPWSRTRTRRSRSVMAAPSSAAAGSMAVPISDQLVWSLRFVTAWYGPVNRFASRVARSGRGPCRTVASRWQHADKRGSGTRRVGPLRAGRRCLFGLLQPARFGPLADGETRDDERQTPRRGARARTPVRVPERAVTTSKPEGRRHRARRRALHGRGERRADHRDDGQHAHRDRLRQRHRRAGRLPGRDDRADALHRRLHRDGALHHHRRAPSTASSPTGSARSGAWPPARSRRWPTSSSRAR